MSRTKIIISVGAILLVIGIFLLPKVVVDNKGSSAVQEDEGVEQTGATSENPPLNEIHNAPISSEDEQLLASLRENYKNNEDNKKSAIFADSLAVVFKRNNKLDSAAKYFAVAAEYAPSKEALVRAGDAYYEAFTYAVAPDKSQELGKKARDYYERVMEDDGQEMLDVKAKVAMTYIASSEPMKGIGLLREILEKDPRHEGAIFNLGMLSIQSNQYEKAIERFEQLVSLYPENLQAQYYLGLSYFEAGRKTMAKKQFEKVKSLDNDPEVQAAADSYLEEIQ